MQLAGRVADGVLFQVGSDPALVRQQLKGYAAIAAGTLYSTAAQDDVPAELWEELRQMKEQYDYYQHGNSGARHAELITDRILDAVAIAGTPEEAIPRFQALVDLSVENFVLPVTTQVPMDMIRLLAERVIPNIKSRT